MIPFTDLVSRPIALYPDTGHDTDISIVGCKIRAGAKSPPVARQQTCKDKSNRFASIFAYNFPAYRVTPRKLLLQKPHINYYSSCSIILQ